MNIIKYGGGWGYSSECGRFEFINLAKCDILDGRKTGWHLIDKKSDECEWYQTLKEAKETAEFYVTA